MSAPYWGQLPGPTKVSGQSKGRRMSDEYSSPGDQRQSVDAPGQISSKTKRVSVQTTNTESTMSPYASPTASTFKPEGLAPRPPSFTYGPQHPQPSELYEKRRRRESRNREVEAHQAAEVAPPAAPDAPRAPPVSYKHPYGNGGFPHTHPQQPPPSRSGPPSRRSSGAAPQMGPEEHYKQPSPEGQPDYPVLERSRQSLDAGHGSRRRGSVSHSDQPKGPVIKDVMNGHGRRGSTDTVDPTPQRKGSVATESDRLKKFANEHSPLQRLELTLDSITKEEKRARVEAAEQRARERASQNADLVGSQPVRSRERRASVSQGAQRPQLTDPAQAQSLIEPPGSSQRPLGDVSQRESTTRLAERPHFEEPPISPNAQDSGIPQRNLSFRERAARNDVKLPSALEAESPTSPQAVPASSLARSGSNKLKKEPPGDPWYTRRVESERRYLSVQARNEQGAEPLNNGPPVARPSGSSVRVHGPPPTDPRGVPAPPRQVPAEQFDYPRAGPAKLVKAPAQAQFRPVEQDTFRPTPHGAEYPGNGTARGFGPQQAVQVGVATGAALVAAAPRRAVRYADDEPERERNEAHHHHHVSNLMYHARDKLQPGQGVYSTPSFHDEWKKATVGTLSGALLDLDDEPAEGPDKSKTWWETPPSKRRGSMPTRPRKEEAFDGEYDETNAPTRFKPPLYLKCGPLLRYCGIRREPAFSRANRNGDAAPDREIWRGSVMIVTQDTDSSYDIAPTLRMFAQPLELLPPPPIEIKGEQVLPPEYVDPIAGHPKLGRKGETLYVRPVEHLEESKDLSRDESDDGIYEKTKSPPDVVLEDGSIDPPGSFASRKKRITIDGERVNKYKEVRGFRLHRDRGYTFWRFNIEVELRDKQQRIAYRINQGPSTGFWVPARSECMNIMFHSCNGFSLSVNPDQFCGPDPMWRDVLNTHQSQPFHAMIGGGDQIYNDAVMRQTKIFQNWLSIKNPLHKHNAPFTAEMQDELESFYLERYCMWFSQGLFGMANAQIPMVNMYDDHDIIDGFGSYPHHFMNSPVFSGLGNVAFKYYMLFQHQSVPDETEAAEPSWILGQQPGPYTTELSRSLYMSMGGNVALLAVDCRTERTRDEVVSEETWRNIMDRCYAEIVKGKVHHLLVLLGIPIAYPRLVWLENILTSRLMDPVKALGKTGLLGNFLNQFDGGVEVLDDLDDHWTSKTHKHERSIVIEDLQDLAADKSVRVTILSGDVHLAAVGQFYSNPKLHIPKHKDFRYMPNIISSAIVNTPPSDLLADILNKRNKVHHFDHDTDEDMIPLFGHGVDGKSRNNKRLLPHRNWCSIREYAPGTTPPPSPEQSTTVLAQPTPGSMPNLIRRLSKRRPSAAPGPDPARPDPSRPPLSNARWHNLSQTASIDSPGPNKSTRALSLSRSDFNPTNLFRRLSSRRGNKKKKRPDDGGINGQWGEESEEDLPSAQMQSQSNHSRDSHPSMGLRGGASRPSVYDEFDEGDEFYFTAKPASRHAKILGEDPLSPGSRGVHSIPRSEAAPTTPGLETAPPASVSASSVTPRPFHRTPTGLSVKQMKHGAAQYEVNLEGGLSVCLNVEVNQKDPAGITAPYKLLVPRLWHEDELPPAAAPGAAAMHGAVGAVPPPSNGHQQGQGEDGGGGEDDDDDENEDEDDDYDPDVYGNGGYVPEKPSSAIKRIFSLQRNGSKKTYI